MGLFSKVKSILFDEDNTQIPMITKEEEEVIETPEKIKEKEIVKEEVKEFTKEPVFEEPPKKKEFDFPIVFDEDEFETRSSRKSNVLTYEKEEKKIEHKRYESSVFKPKSVMTEEEKKFKPTPVISPVFGIVDKDIDKDEYFKDQEKTQIKRADKTIDVDSIRNKAYGQTELPKEKFFDKELQEDKTIGDLMSLEEEVDVPEIPIIEEEKPLVKPKEELIVDEPKEEIEDPLKVLDEMEKDLSSFNKEEHDENDTVETDLFNLIDSMYEDREEGE